MASRTAYSTWTPQKPTLFEGHYLRNRSTLDIGVLGYIGIVQHKEVGNFVRLVCCNVMGPVCTEVRKCLNGSLEGCTLLLVTVYCVVPRRHGSNLILLPVWSGSRTVSVRVIPPSFPTVH